MINLILAQIVGLFGFVLNITSTLRSNKNKILIYNALANTASIIQYLLLGAWTGAISCFIAVTRNIFFLKYKNNIPLKAFIIYILIAIPFNLIGYNGIISLLPVFNIILYAYGLYQKNVGVLKIITIIVSISGLIYDAFILAFVGVLSQGIAMIGSIIGYLNYKKGLSQNI